jgi:hypothetical protein
VLFPNLNEIICPLCAGFIKLPLGNNLTTLLMDNIHLEQSAISGFQLNGILAINAPNN